VISGLLKRLTSETAADLGKTIESCLSEIVDILEAKRVCWYVHNEETSALRRIYSARRPGIQPSPELIDTSDIPYTAERLMNRENFVLRSINDLPDEARTDRSFYEKQSIRGLMLIASNCGSRRVGILEISFEPTEVEIPEELVSRLSTLNNVIVTTVERKIAYNLLGESEKRFRGLVQNAPIGIVLENMDGGITFVNPTLCSMLDYSEEELLGMRCADFSDPTTNSKDEILFAKVRKGEIDRYTVE
jgi:PAS domain-containing protein